MPIYQAHNNPYGKNPFIDTKLGNLDMTYADIQHYINYGLAQKNVADLFQMVQLKAYDYMRTIESFGGMDQLNFYAAVYEYGIAIKDNILDYLAETRPDIYTGNCLFSVYDSSGILIYDNRLGGV